MSVVEKLKVKDGEIAVLGAPAEILRQFKALKAETSIRAGSKERFDFVLLFATHSKALETEWKTVTPALKQDAMFWVAYPRKTSGIESDLAGMKGWTVYKGSSWQPVASAAIDETWTGLRFRYAPGLESKRQERVSENISDSDGTVVIDRANRVVTPPKDFAAALRRNNEARALFEGLSFTNKKEYVLWIVESKKAETRAARLQSAIEKLAAGKRRPSDK